MVEADSEFEDVQKHVAANVARRRAKLGRTQQEVADAAGLDLKHVQKLEYADLNPTLRTLVRVATALETTVDKLTAPTKAPAPSRPVGRPRTTRSPRRR